MLGGSSTGPTSGYSTQPATLQRSCQTSTFHAMYQTSLIHHSHNELSRASPILLPFNDRELGMRLYTQRHPIFYHREHLQRFNLESDINIGQHEVCSDFLSFTLIIFMHERRSIYLGGIKIYIHNHYLPTSVFHNCAVATQVRTYRIIAWQATQSLSL